MVENIDDALKDELEEVGKKIKELKDSPWAVDQSTYFLNVLPYSSCSTCPTLS